MKAIIHEDEFKNHDNFEKGQKLINANRTDELKASMAEALVAAVTTSDQVLFNIASAASIELASKSGYSVQDGINSVKQTAQLGDLDAEEAINFYNLVK
jgi:hypothetical protein